MMYQKVTSLISLFVLLLLVGNAPADTFTWDSGGGNNLWSTQQNWEPDGLPTNADDARIEDPNANCLIDSSVTAECISLTMNSNSSLEMTGGSLTMDGFLTISDDADSNSVMIMSGGVANMGTLNGTNGRVRVAYRGIGTLIMTGGELNSYDKVEVGRQAGAVGYLYLYDGTINFSGNSTDLEIGTNGTGYVYQYGGVFNVQDNIKLTQNNADAVARLYLYGGVMNAGNLRDPEQMLGDPLMDITEGTLILPGDYREVVNEYINRGWIVPYGGLGLLNVEYTADPNQTTITASNLPPELASIPSPRNKAQVMKTAEGVTLNWTPGDFAASHNVYFGTDPNAVNDANDVPGLWPEFKVSQDSNSFDLGVLELGETYYWRIDEVNEADPNSPWKGVVWEFSLADYIVVDDFESYNEIPDGQEGSNLVYFTWSDGYADPSVNGSTMGYLFGDSLERDNVHGGDQAVPLMYNNTQASYSEASVNLADLSVSPDFAADNLQTLSIWVNGGPGNSAEQMYVKLNGIKVNVGQPVELRVVGWQEKTIDLDLFSGLDLSNVTELGIGFDKTGAVGGTGTMLIDDIRLYTAADEQ
ncbi:MAG: hypothetical protein JW715_07160 [Sedimentisphaerales bacterium]|nr:hypothetical protein [Sedimentisphaerales bacterium]